MSDSDPTDAESDRDTERPTDVEEQGQQGSENPPDRDVDESSKREQLDDHRETPAEGYLTTDQGVRVDDNDNSLTAGPRGPTLMEDFHFREKMTHFDHESIPERVVHARGTGAHGYFQPYDDPDLGPYDDVSELTKASFLQDPGQKTPVFVRFSTVVGSRGSADTVRDVRGFATKFYTAEGNYDLVANNMPVFFIQDAMKFPDLVHAIKPEPDDEIPQASAAHDTFWDFASLQPEITHMLMWVLSDRALPRYYRMMEGFGVHTFRFVNDQGAARFVKFHWRPTYGTHSLVWDETQKLAGKDPDFNRRNLYSAIENGDYPEWELGVQIVEPEEVDELGFDLLDPTKIIPEEEVPVRPLGRMVLDETPDNFFAETEQAAFHPGNLVSGIDVTNDPLLQGRLFSYQDTQLNRFNGANWDEVPINRPVAEVDNDQRAGFMRQRIDGGKGSYKPNSLADDEPTEATEAEGAYVHYPERVEGAKIRKRPESFGDHFSQARLFWNSMSEAERDHIVDATHFELGKVEREDVRKRVIYDLFNNVDHELAVRAAKGVGIDPPEEPGEHLPDHDRESPALSQENTEMDTIETRRIAVLVADGFDDDQVQSVRSALQERGATVEVVSKLLGERTGTDGAEVEADKSHVTSASIMYDAIVVPGGRDSVDALLDQGDARHFVAEAFKHKKPIGATGAGVEVLRGVELPGIDVGDDESGVVSQQGVVTCPGDGGMDAFVDAFAEAIAAHRHWERNEESVSA